MMETQMEMEERTEDEYGYYTPISSAYKRHRTKGILFTIASRAQQHFKDECDINRIIERFTKTGLIPQIQAISHNADVSDFPSFQEAMDFIIETREQFMELPAKIRKYFNNDPGELVAFLEDPENFDEALRLGLVERPATEAVRPSPEGVAPQPSPEGESPSHQNPT
jgi:phage internal scaffolding protein